MPVSPSKVPCTICGTRDRVVHPVTIVINGDVRDGHLCTEDLAGVRSIWSRFEKRPGSPRRRRTVTDPRQKPTKDQ